MSVSTYEFLSIVQEKESSDNGGTVAKSIDYQSVLNHVRGEIAAKHAQELSLAMEDEIAEAKIKSLILKYTTQMLAGHDYDRNALVERIHRDMASLGILTPYLRDNTVEEININGYDTIEIVRNGYTEFLTGKDAFPNAETAVAITKRMVRMGGKLLDAQTPRVDSYIGSGTRISAMIPPIVPEERGVGVSIRKQVKSRLTEAQLIEGGTGTQEMLDFLSICICNGVSIGLAGGTGSGKTTVENYILNEYIRKNDDQNSRIFIIEDSRELNLLAWDEENNRPARVIYTMTKPAPNPVSMFDLIVTTLRFHPKLIVPAEVRDEAAYQAAIAGQTGHTVLTSFHADSSADAYSRLVALCTRANTGLTDARLMETCIGAWPIMVFAKQLKDGSRKIMEIFEATGEKDGKVVGQMLFTFQSDVQERDANGHIIRISGQHKRVGTLSPKLCRRLIDNGAAIGDIQRIFPDARLG